MRIETSMSAIVQEHQELIWWIAAFSGVIFAASLVVVPWLVVRIPTDYFATQRRPRTSFANQHPVLRWTGLIVKNLTGVLLILAGIAMLILPGQGLLTVAIGVLLLDFPNKHLMERRIIRIQPVLKSINWLRRTANVGPLQIDDDRSAQGSAS
jgi:hypothetical protein